MASALAIPAQSMARWKPLPIAAAWRRAGPETLSDRTCFAAAVADSCLWMLGVAAPDDPAA